MRLVCLDDLFDFWSIINKNYFIYNIYKFPIYLSEKELNILNIFIANKKFKFGEFVDFIKESFNIKII